MGAPAIHVYEQYNGSSFHDFFSNHRNVNNFQTQQDKTRNQHNREEKDNIDLLLLLFIMLD